MPRIRRSCVPIRVHSALVLTFATYPRLVDDGHAQEPALSRTLSILEGLIPLGSGLHVLPFAPSSGDYGFAPDDWLAVDPALADWPTLRSAAGSYRLILDGVYNHVGVGHRWFREFIDSSGAQPEGVFFARSAEVAAADPRVGPRGYPILRALRPDSSIFVVHTFSDAAVDVNLDNDVVVEEIRRHLAHLADLGAYGVRLDAAAYYGKVSNGSIRHNAESIRLTDKVASLVEEYGLRALPQLDVDAQTLPYDDMLAGHDAALVDLAFPAVLYAALREGAPAVVADHCAAVGQRGFDAFRSFRSHDGVLLRSASVTTEHMGVLQQLAEDAAGPVRITGGTPYELNASGPALGRALNPSDPYAVILLAVAITAFLSRNPYFYIPALLGFEPEAHGKRESDPRAVNRRPLSLDHLNGPAADNIARLRPLLAAVEEVQRCWQSVKRPGISRDGSSLLVEVGHSRLQANFDGQRSAPMRQDGGELVYRSAEGTELHPYEAAITTSRPARNKTP